MARKRHSDEDILKLLREIELHLAGGADVATACRAVGVSDGEIMLRLSTSLVRQLGKKADASCEITVLDGRARIG